MKDDKEKKPEAETEAKSGEHSKKLKELLAPHMQSLKSREKRRSTEILEVFARHNFYMGGFTPVELRTTLEDLGPTFVKIGQIMSGRSDVLPKEYCDELTKLRANVKQLDPAIARAVIEQETGRSIDEIFSEFRDEPVGSASIAQAHFGVLKDGTKVVTKVQRPLIADMMRKDFVILHKFASLVNSIEDEKGGGTKTVDMVSVLEEFEKVTEEELDFRIEADNTRFFKENCIEDEDKISCPTIIDELSTERIMTMTFVDGYSISKKERMIEQGYDLDDIGRSILNNFMYQVLDVGTFHADPHQGNIMVSAGKPYWIDFGMIGHVSDSAANMMQKLIFSLLEKDTDSLVSAVISMGATTEETDREKLTEDIDMYIEKYMSVRSISDIDMSTLLDDFSDVCSKHHIHMPGEYTMLARAVITIEGVVEELCPELNLFDIVTKRIMDKASKNEDMKNKLLDMGKDALSSSKKAVKIPGLTYGVLNNLVKGRTKIKMELTGYDELVAVVMGIVKSLIPVFFSCFIFLGSCVLCLADIEPKTSGGMPVLALIGFIISVALAIFTVRRMMRKKR